MVETMKTHLCKSELKSRGWTDGLIDKILGNPNMTRKNPKHRHGAPMKLFLVWRVEMAERRAEFQSRQRRVGA
jgi:hypothetical protein